MTHPTPPELAPAHLLATHDAHLRGRAELADATHLARIGPLWLGRYAEYGFVSYTDLDGVDGHTLDGLIEAAVRHFDDDPEVAEFEWKTREHDAADHLSARLQRAGFVPQAEEAVMIGNAALLARPAPLPDGLTIRQVAPDDTAARHVHRVGEFHARVFDHPYSPSRDAELLHRLTARPDVNAMWLIEEGDVIVSAGRLAVVEGTTFAGLWGGATDERWRHRGLYRALTSARAYWGLNRGLEYLYAECTPFSRPILESAGLVQVTTTTPYLWTRA